MKLFYHGVSYEYDPSEVPAQSQSQHAFNLMYRGTTYRVDPNPEPVELPETQTAHNLSYRGTTYVVNGSTQADVRGVFPRLAQVW